MGGQGGSPGIVGTSIGGGAGVNATAQTGNFEVTQGEGAFTKELEEGCDSLMELAEAAGAGDKGRIAKLLHSLKEAVAIPASILAMCQVVLQLANLIT